MSIGENIRRLRLARGMSQTELAEKSGKNCAVIGFDG